MSILGLLYLLLALIASVLLVLYVLQRGALRSVGELSQQLQRIAIGGRLEGRVIEIHGPVKLYDGRAEIILKRVSQLTGGSTLIPPMPKNYDVERHGKFSPGKITYPKAAKKTQKKQSKRESNL